MERPFGGQPVPTWENKGHQLTHDEVVVPSTYVNHTLTLLFNDAGQLLNEIKNESNLDSVHIDHWRIHEVRLNAIRVKGLLPLADPDVIRLYPETANGLPNVNGHVAGPNNFIYLMGDAFDTDKVQRFFLPIVLASDNDGRIRIGREPRFRARTEDGTPLTYENMLVELGVTYRTLNKTAGGPPQ